jgi:hypothetical protein
MEMPPYSGPRGYDLGGDDRVGSEHKYQPVTTSYPEAREGGSNRIEPSWGGDDCLPAHDLSQDGGRRRR